VVSADLNFQMPFCPTLLKIDKFVKEINEGKSPRLSQLPNHLLSPSQSRKFLKVMSHNDIIMEKPNSDKDYTLDFETGSDCNGN
jgi:hypothetical protein